MRHWISKLGGHSILLVSKLEFCKVSYRPSFSVSSLHENQHDKKTLLGLPSSLSQNPFYCTLTYFQEIIFTGQVF